MTPVFTSSKMKKMFQIILDCSDEFIKRTRESIKKDDILDARDLMANYTTDSITSCAFGLNPKTTSVKEKELSQEFRKIGKMFVTPSKMRVIVEFLFAAMPNVMRSLGIKSLPVPDSFVNFFVNVVKSCMHSRSNIPSNRHDLIDLMMELKIKGFIARDKNDTVLHTENSFEGDLKITDDLITAQAFSFFIAGFETSSTLMSYALYELALQPKLQEKLQNEIDIALKQHDGKITYESIHTIEYLEMVINETLRKHPSLGVLSRVCNSKYKIPGTDVVIDKSVQIVIPTYSIQRDPKYYPEPEKFIPERFSSDPEHPIVPFTYLPFGDGPRNCIGLRFGRIQSAVGLISILREFSVEPCKKTTLNIKLDVTGLFVSPDHELWLKFVPRK